MMQISAYGRLGKAPKEIATRTGTTMAVASVAADMTSEKHPEAAPLWLGIVAFGKLAEKLLKHSQGELVSVFGRGQLNTWTDKDGQEQRQIQVVLDGLMSARTTRPGGGRKKASTPAPTPTDPNDDLPIF